MWDLGTGTLQCVLHAHFGPISVARVFPDSERVVLGSKRHGAVIWNASACALIHELPHPSGGVTGVAVLSGGALVATACPDGFVGLWDAGSGRRLRVLTRPSTWVMDLTSGMEAFPAGDRLATFSLMEVTIWNVTSGAPPPCRHRPCALSGSTLARPRTPCGRDVRCSLGPPRPRTLHGTKLSNKARSTCKSEPRS